jgi:hypothetical protein
MNRKTIAVIVCGLVLASAVPAFAQRFEFGVAWNFYNPGFDATYHSRYSPAYLSGGAYSSLAEQTLTLRAKEVSGLSAFVSYFPARNFGLQFMAEYFKAGFNGSNGNYAYSLTYQRPMPDHTFRTASYANAFEFPATEGDIREIVLSLNAIFRLPLTRLLSLSFSGGPSYFYTDAAAGFIGYTKFFTSDDRLLHIQDYRLAYEFGPQSRLGFNAGVEAAVHVSALIAFFGEFRLFKTSGEETPLHITASDILTDSVADIESRLGLGSLKVDPSFTRFSVGVKFTF